MTDLNLEIISPNGVVFKGNCHLATIPSSEGEMGVMNGHEAVVVTLKSGEVVIYDDKQKELKKFAVEGGFAEVRASGDLLVLVE
jgi:F-type H+-transporting ATPase subunit epsilon